MKYIVLYFTWTFSGEMVLANIEELLSSIDEGDEITTSILSINITSLIKKLEMNSELSHWAKLLQVQFDEVNIVGKELLSPISSKKCERESSKKVQFSKDFKPFTPLVDNRCRIVCQEKDCPTRGRFAYRRTYVQHMLTHHPGVEVSKKVRDPPGHCRLISEETGYECGAKGIYDKKVL